MKSIRYDTIPFPEYWRMEDWTGVDQMNLATLNSPDLKDSKYNAEESCGGRGGSTSFCPQPRSCLSTQGAQTIPRLV